MVYFSTYFTHTQTCDNVRVHRATQWTASVQTLRMLVVMALKSVDVFVFLEEVMLPPRTVSDPLGYL